MSYVQRTLHSPVARGVRQGVCCQGARFLAGEACAKVVMEEPRASRGSGLRAWKSCERSWQLSCISKGKVWLAFAEWGEDVPC